MIRQRQKQYNLLLRRPCQQHAYGFRDNSKSPLSSLQKTTKIGSSSREFPSSVSPSSSTSLFLPSSAATIHNVTEGRDLAVHSSSAYGTLLLTEQLRFLKTSSSLQKQKIKKHSSPSPPVESKKKETSSKISKKLSISATNKKNQKEGSTENHQKKKVATMKKTSNNTFDDGAIFEIEAEDGEAENDVDIQWKTNADSPLTRNLASEETEDGIVLLKEPSPAGYPPSGKRKKGRKNIGGTPTTNTTEFSEWREIEAEGERKEEVLEGSDDEEDPVDWDSILRQLQRFADVQVSNAEFSGYVAKLELGENSTSRLKLPTALALLQLFDKFYIPVNYPATRLVTNFFVGHFLSSNDAAAANVSGKKKNNSSVFGSNDKGEKGRAEDDDDDDDDDDEVDTGADEKNKLYFLEKQKKLQNTHTRNLLDFCFLVANGKSREWWASALPVPLLLHKISMFLADELKMISSLKYTDGNGKVVDEETDEGVNPPFAFSSHITFAGATLIIKGLDALLEGQGLKERRQSAHLKNMQKEKMVSSNLGNTSPSLSSSSLVSVFPQETDAIFGGEQNAFLAKFKNDNAFSSSITFSSPIELFGRIRQQLQEILSKLTETYSVDPTSWTSPEEKQKQGEAEKLEEEKKSEQKEEDFFIALDGSTEEVENGAAEEEKVEAATISSDPWALRHHLHHPSSFPLTDFLETLMSLKHLMFAAVAQIVPFLAMKELIQLTSTLTQLSLLQQTSSSSSPDIKRRSIRNVVDEKAKMGGIRPQEEKKDDQQNINNDDLEDEGEGEEGDTINNSLLALLNCVVDRVILIQTPKPLDGIGWRPAEISDFISHLSKLTERMDILQRSLKTTTSSTLSKINKNDVADGNNNLPYTLRVVRQKVFTALHVYIQERVVNNGGAKKQKTKERSSEKWGFSAMQTSVLLEALAVAGLTEHEMTKGLSSYALSHFIPKSVRTSFFEENKKMFEKESSLKNQMKKSNEEEEEEAGGVEVGPQGISALARSLAAVDADPSIIRLFLMYFHSAFLTGSLSTKQRFKKKKLNSPFDEDDGIKDGELEEDEEVTPLHLRHICAAAVAINYYPSELMLLCATMLKQSAAFRRKCEFDDFVTIVFAVGSYFRLVREEKAQMEMKMKKEVGSSTHWRSSLKPVVSSSSSSVNVPDEDDFVIVDAEKEKKVKKTGKQQEQEALGEEETAHQQEAQDDIQQRIQALEEFFELMASHFTKSYQQFAQQHPPELVQRHFQAGDNAMMKNNINFSSHSSAMVLRAFCDAKLTVTSHPHLYRVLIQQVIQSVRSYRALECVQMLVLGDILGLKYLSSSLEGGDGNEGPVSEQVGKPQTSSPQTSANAANLTSGRKPVSEAIYMHALTTQLIATFDDEVNQLDDVLFILENLPKVGVRELKLYHAVARKFKVLCMQEQQPVSKDGVVKNRQKTQTKNNIVVSGNPIISSLNEFQGDQTNPQLLGTITLRITHASVTFLKCLRRVNFSKTLFRDLEIHELIMGTEKCIEAGLQQGEAETSSSLFISQLAYLASNCLESNFLFQSTSLISNLIAVMGRRLSSAKASSLKSSKKQTTENAISQQPPLQQILTQFSVPTLFHICFSTQKFLLKLQVATASSWAGGGHSVKPNTMHQAAILKEANETCRAVYHLLMQSTKGKSSQDKGDEIDDDDKILLREIPFSQLSSMILLIAEAPSDNQEVAILSSSEKKLLIGVLCRKLLLEFRLAYEQEPASSPTKTITNNIDAEEKEKSSASGSDLAPPVEVLLSQSASCQGHEGRGKGSTVFQLKNQDYRNLIDAAYLLAVHGIQNEATDGKTKTKMKNMTAVKTKKTTIRALLMNPKGASPMMASNNGIMLNSRNDRNGDEETPLAFMKRILHKNQSNAIQIPSLFRVIAKSFPGNRNVAPASSSTSAAGSDDKKIRGSDNNASMRSSSPTTSFTLFKFGVEETVKLLTCYTLFKIRDDRVIKHIFHHVGKYYTVLKKNDAHVYLVQESVRVFGTHWAGEKLMKGRAGIVVKGPGAEGGSDLQKEEMEMQAATDDDMDSTEGEVVVEGISISKEGKNAEVMESEADEEF